MTFHKDSILFEGLRAADENIALNRFFDKVLLALDRRGAVRFHDESILFEGLRGAEDGAEIGGAV